MCLPRAARPSSFPPSGGRVLDTAEGRHRAATRSPRVVSAGPGGVPFPTGNWLRDPHPPTTRSADFGGRFRASAHTPRFTAPRSPARGPGPYCASGFLSHGSSASRSRLGSSVGCCCFRAGLWELAALMLLPSPVLSDALGPPCFTFLRCSLNSCLGAEGREVGAWCPRGSDRESGAHS